MATNEAMNRRLKALESRANPEEALRVIVREGQESKENCMRRHGYTPELARGRIIVLEREDIGVL